jgi:hypothetical protein
LSDIQLSPTNSNIISIEILDGLDRGRVAQLTGVSITSADCEYQDARFEIIADGFEVMDVTLTRTHTSSSF